MGAMTRRGMEKALAKLEDVAVAKARSVPAIPFDEADWLAWFTQVGKEKRFARELDFPVALALLRDELAMARASTDPPFDPPEDFQPDQRHLHIRRENWRHAGRFPALCEALGWLGEMLDRARDGIPPVTVAEHAELAAWFAAHEPGLAVVAKQLNPDGLMSVGSGRRVVCWYVRYDLRAGPRGEGSGQVAEDIRQLRARYGEQAATLMLQPRGDA